MQHWESSWPRQRVSHNGQPSGTKQTWGPSSGFSRSCVEKLAHSLFSAQIASRSGVQTNPGKRWGASMGLCIVILFNNPYIPLLHARLKTSLMGTQQPEVCGRFCSGEGPGSWHSSQVPQKAVRCTSIGGPIPHCIDISSQRGRHILNLSCRPCFSRTGVLGCEA